MYKRKMASLSAAFVFGIALTEYGHAGLQHMALFYGSAGLLLAGYFAVGVKKKTPCWHYACFIAALAAAAVCGSCRAILRESFCIEYESRLNDGDICLLQGEIYQKSEDGESCLYYLKKCRVRDAKEERPCDNVLVNLEVFDYSIGEILCVKGKIKTFSQPSNEGGYDEKAYYQSQKIGFRIRAKKADAVYGRPDAFREWLWSAKQKMKMSYQKAMPKADAGVLAAMVLGDKSLMDKERKDMYQKAGISHFYSISGLHISLLGMALYHFVKKRGLPYLFSCGAASVWILGYGEMVGFGISASRAIGMFLIMMYAKYRGRSYDTVTALALMAAICAGENPKILHQAGFWLSFGAVAGVVMAKQLLSDRADEKKESEKHRIWDKLCEALLVSSCIQLMTLPVMCQFFYEISVYTMLINLLVLPCMGLLLGMGVLGGAAGCFFPLAAKLILYPCYLILWVFETACKVILRLPYSVFITGRLSLYRIVFWYGAIVLFLAVRQYVSVRSSKRLPLFCLALPLGIVLLAQPVLQFEMDVLDVGQGDGIYIAAGDGTSLFLDGGSTDVNNVGTYRILPFLKCRGIRKVDYWFVSHCDADHINGLVELMEAGYKIGHLVVSESMPADEASQALKILAAQKNIPVLVMGQGDAVKGKKETWKCKCISPKETDFAEDRNANSLVLLYESRECRAFFGGDIAIAQEEALLAEQKLQKVDIYKASHHGSDTSNGEAVLAALKPEIAVISCSLRNSYGHPGKEASKRLREVTGRIYETRYLGQIKITGIHLEEEVSGMLKCSYEDD